MLRGIHGNMLQLESVQAQLADKEVQEVNFTEERQKLMQTLEATKGMLEDLQEELETHDHDLQQKLHEAEDKLEQEKVANRMLSRQLQSEQDKSNSVTKQLEVFYRRWTILKDINFAILNYKPKSSLIRW